MPLASVHIVHQFFGGNERFSTGYSGPTGPGSERASGAPRKRADAVRKAVETPQRTPRLERLRHERREERTRGTGKNMKNSRKACAPS
jgi:hypothetical protein